MPEICWTPAVLYSECSHLSFSFEFQTTAAVPSENQAWLGCVQQNMSYNCSYVWSTKFVTSTKVRNVILPMQFHMDFRVSVACRARL